MDSPGRRFLDFGGAAAGGPPVNEHSAGTCRLAEDPAHSACDPSGRLHGVDNVWVADASLHPTNGSVNPGLTVLANAFRVADKMLREAK
jgi:choline dehydrogenase-like flavoprotein